MNKPQKLEPCVLTIKEHEGRVNAVAWSPDGGTIASASDDNTVKVRAAPARRPGVLQRFSQHVQQRFRQH